MSRRRARCGCESFTFTLEEPSSRKIFHPVSVAENDDYEEEGNNDGTATADGFLFD
jgi:hypothetical protein